MNRERAKELLPIIQAFAEGKEVELKGHAEEFHRQDQPAFDSSREYRIKPEPFECWVNIYDGDVAGHLTEEDAVQCCNPSGRTIHMREVVGEPKRGKL